MRAYGKRTNKGSLVVMFAALTLLFVFLADILPPVRILLYFIASAFIMGIMVERMTSAAFITFGAVTVLAFLLLPDKTGALPYLLFFGHYGIFKYFADDSRGGAGTVIKKLLYFNGCAALIRWQTGTWMTAGIPFAVPWWGVVIAGEIAFLFYDWALSKLTQWYYGSLRHSLLNTGEF